MTLQDVLAGIDVTILGYFVAITAVSAVLLMAAAIELRSHFATLQAKGSWRLHGSAAWPRISLLEPVRDQASTLRASVEALLALDYPALEVVVINDGSSDTSMEVLREHFALTPIHPIFRRQLDTRQVRQIFRSRTHLNLIVIDKEPGGRADSLNTGLNVASGTLVCAIDAGTVVESDGLERMVRPFLLRPDVVAVGGMTRVLNDTAVEDGRVDAPRVPRSWLAGIQVVEFFRTFLFGRLGWQRLGGNVVITGAFGLFRRDAMLAVGGYEPAGIGADTELAVRLRCHGYETKTASWIDFVPDPVAWTEVPESMAVLGEQRALWYRGLASVAARHWRVLFNPRYGAMGLVVFPCFVFVDLLAPLLEAAGWVAVLLGLWMEAVNVPFAVVFLLVTYGAGIIFSVASLLLEELSFHRYEGLRDLTRLLACAIVENLGYRQLTLYWRLRGLIQFLLGGRDSKAEGGLAP